jgi:hypothetical protein
MIVSAIGADAETALRVARRHRQRSRTGARSSAVTRMRNVVAHGHVAVGAIVEERLRAEAEWSGRR